MKSSIVSRSNTITDESAGSYVGLFFASSSAASQIVSASLHKSHVFGQLFSMYW
jgi:hypothetical protein